MKQSTEEHFASHWLTIQPSLFDFLEDEVGELDDNQRLFVRIAESVELGRIARKYGWCGNGRKPSSRLAMFKMFVMKHVWNIPTTKDALAEVRRCPSMRRLCGWESQSGIPSESTISRTFGDFAVKCSRQTTITRQNFMFPVLSTIMPMHSSRFFSEVIAKPLGYAAL